MRKLIFGSLALAWAITVLSPIPTTLSPIPKSETPKPMKVDLAETPNKAEAKFLIKMAEVIRVFGYDCQRIDHAFPHIFSHGFEVFCTGRLGTEYEFSLDDHGGKWGVTAY
jgi:hypothetical protein